MSFSSASSDANDREGSAIADILQQEPIYYVLSQFLETPENKNIACILQDLVSEIRELRITLQASKNNIDKVGEVPV